MQKPSKIIRYKIRSKIEKQYWKLKGWSKTASSHNKDVLTLKEASWCHFILYNGEAYALFPSFEVYFPSNIQGCQEMAMFSKLEVPISRDCPATAILQKWDTVCQSMKFWHVGKLPLVWPVGILSLPQFSKRWTTYSFLLSLHNLHKQHSSGQSPLSPDTTVVLWLSWLAMQFFHRIQCIDITLYNYSNRLWVRKRFVSKLWSEIYVKWWRNVAAVSQDYLLMGS